MAKCGRCGQTGPEVTVANIRECYNGQPKAHGDPTVAAVKNPWPPSEAQIKYVLGLQVERELPDIYKVLEDHDLRAMDKGEVSSTITVLKTFKRKDSAKQQTQWSMPSGRYAIRVSLPQADIRKVGQGDDKEWRFYNVDKPTEGKWKGYTFIKRLIGGGDDGGYRKVDMSAHERDLILKEIERDPKQAMIDYGKHTGSCGHCGRALSNAQSLALGIGPICAGKMGW